MKKISLLILSAFVIMLSCSKDKSSQEPQVINGGEVLKGQIVTITLPESSLNVDEYKANMDGIDITLSKKINHDFFFFVPFEATIGSHDLVIPSLNNTKVNYSIKELVLAEKPEVVMASFNSNLLNFSQRVDTSSEGTNVLTSVNSFNDIYSHASQEDKNKMATIYSLNKALFDSILLNDYSTVLEKNFLPDVALLARHSHAVYAMVGGAFVCLYALDPFEKALGASVAAIGAYKAYKFFEQIQVENLNTITLNIDDIDGVNNKKNSSINLDNDVERTVNINSKDRCLIESDSKNTQSGIANFFMVYNKYNSYVGKINTAISWVNSKVPFSNIKLISSEKLSETANTTNNPVSSELFKHIKFSINHPNLALESAFLQNDGKLSLKVKIIGNPSETPVVSALKYTYSDAINSLSGSIPITVNADYLITNASIASWSDIGVTCPTAYKSGKASIMLTFNNSTAPQSGIIRCTTSWGSGSNGIDVDISKAQISGNTITFPGGYCWGNSSVVLIATYRYISTTNYQSNLYTYTVPRP